MNLPAPTIYSATASKPHDYQASGWRLLLAIGLMLVFSASAGRVTWWIVHTISPSWISTVDFVYGIAVGWVRERTGSTFNTAVMHVMVDAALLIVASLLILR